MCIYHLQGHPPVLWDRVNQHRGRVFTSSICYGEVMLGIMRTGRVQTSGTQALFSEVEVLPFDRAAADVYARLPFRRAGFDRLIAAHAVALGAVLVTNNPTDFLDIAELRTENWTL